MRKACVVVAFLLIAACRRGATAGATPGESPTDRPTTSEPTAAELDALVTGAGQLRLGMTEPAAIASLGQPSQRHDPASPGDSTDLLWEHLPGAHPGNAMGRFLNGKLTYFEVAPANPPWPSVSREAAQSLETADIVSRAVAGRLPLSEIESVTGKRGQLAMITVVRGKNLDANAIVVRRTWAWQVEPGTGQFLVVNEEDGRADQPVTRTTS